MKKYKKIINAIIISAGLAVLTGSCSQPVQKADNRVAVAISVRNQNLYPVGKLTSN